MNNITVLCSLITAFCIMIWTGNMVNADNTTQTLDSLASKVTTASERKSFLELLHKDTIEANLAKPLNSGNEKMWENAFWGMELCLYRNPKTLKSIKMALSSCNKHSDSFTRAALEAAWTLYPTQLRREIEIVSEQTKSPKNFAMAVHYLLKSQPRNAGNYIKLMESRFKNQLDNPILAQLRLNLEKPFIERIRERPPMDDLLRQAFPGNPPVIFSFQRCNRDYPGLAVIRRQDGTFLRRSEGSLFYIQQLARSMGNYPGYLTDGNTPQGIFSIQGTAVSDNSFIGPTPTLQTVLPIEASAAEFFHDKGSESKKWSRDLYRSILPASWQKYEPIYEAYAAGETSRGEIICHGTTIDPEFYINEPYYPNTPSLGCLCSLELWSAQNGQCIYSDQLALIQNYSSLNSSAGYLVVVELDNEPRQVGICDVIHYITEAESSLLK